MPNAKRIHQIPVADRPREKMQARGAQALSDFELLEVFIGNGSASADVGYIARQIHKILDKYGAELCFEQLTSIKGVNVATASKILSALELTRRHLLRDNMPLRSQQDILARLSDIRTKQQEYFVVLTLDGGQRLIAQRTITIGTLDAVLAHPREVYADAIVDRAAGVIVAHNHPSGDIQPSQKDITLTQQLVAAGQLLGIELRDHIIVTRTDQFSCRQHHML
ncbi:MAG: DNA repair protein RadC [Candidatus Saccharimonadales bacterium]